MISILVSIYYIIMNYNELFIRFFSTCVTVIYISFFIDWLVAPNMSFAMLSSCFPELLLIG